ncbi:MAG: hypothetical protein Q4D79_10290 [Propionibacteriaceae bacterium]|nr:hypothetical protein [Propionibacteriaceae bacterium]
MATFLIRFIPVRLTVFAFVNRRGGGGRWFSCGFLSHLPGFRVSVDENPLIGPYGGALGAVMGWADASNDAKGIRDEEASRKPGSSDLKEAIHPMELVTTSRTKTIYKMRP